MGLLSPLLSTGQDPRLLHSLSAGSQLIVKQKLLIPANNASVTIPPGPGANGTRCTLWMNETKPFDRVLQTGDRLQVRGTHRSGFSHRGRIAASASVFVDLSAIQDITCATRQTFREPTIQEFGRAIESHFGLKLATAPQAIVSDPEKLNEATAPQAG